MISSRLASVACAQVVEGDAGRVDAVVDRGEDAVACAVRPRAAGHRRGG